MKKILIADDHSIVREGIRHILMLEKDFRIVGEAGSGREAIRKSFELEPDGIVMDIGMPDINGIEATGHILENLPGIRIVILSARKSPDFIIRAFRAGAAGYLSKDASGKELVQALRAVLYRNTRFIGASLPTDFLSEYLDESTSYAFSPLELLSLREREVLQLTAEGRSSREIAETLNLSIKTVDTYRSRSMKKLSLTTMSQLILFAIRSGLVPEE